MRGFEYRRADDVPSAIAAVAEHPQAAFLGGGTNLVDHMRLDVACPDLLVDVSRLPLNSIDERPDGGLRIGAAVRNSDLAADPRVRSRYPVLSRALLAGASGQLRNVATTGGNLLQRTRCPYFQDISTPCNKREPGTGCSAIGGYARSHAIFGASSTCIAVHPSDMAVGLLVLDATIQVQGPGGVRSIPIDQLHRLPGDRPDLDTQLRHGELITAVDLPATPFAATSAYRKVRDRASYAFALVSVAAAIHLREGRLTDLRLALGGVAHKPWRATRAEAMLRDRKPTDDLLLAAADAELETAAPMPGNEFKVPMVRRTLVAVLQQLIEGGAR